MSLEDFPPQPTKQAPVTPKTLQDLNLEEALLTQYNNTTALLEAAINDPDIPLNQKAQTINSITTILAQITKSQTDLYNAERLKKLEAVLTQTLKTLPKETQLAFLDLYENALNG